MEEALGSASGFDVDPLPLMGHSKGGSEDSQGPLWDAPRRKATEIEWSH